MRITKKKRLERQIHAIMPAFTNALITHGIYHATCGELSAEFLVEFQKRFAALPTKLASAEEVFKAARQLCVDMLAEGKKSIQ